MGFVKKMVTKAIVKKAEDMTMNGLINHVNHLENTRSVEALVNKSAANHILLVKKKNASIKRGFNVYDESGNNKCVIKTDALTFGYPRIRLYDTNDYEIGKVELTSKDGMGTYTMYLDGKKLGTLSRKMSIEIKLELSFNDWHLDGNIMKTVLL